MARIRDPSRVSSRSTSEGIRIAYRSCDPEQGTLIDGHLRSLRLCWIQEFFIAENRVRMRDPKDMPPSRARIESPYDGEARDCVKNASEWSG